MGALIESLKALAPTRTRAIGAVIPTWQEGQAVYPTYPNIAYERLSRDGYGKNELVYSCIEIKATSAAEPRWAAWRETSGDPEKLPRHPAVDLINRPNPWLSRYQLVAGVLMFRDIAGNAYLEKVRSAAGKVVELWPLRPDRMYVLPDRERYIGGWEYRIGAETYRLDTADVIHFKTRNPLDDFYGLPPLAVAGGRVDLDNWMRQFVTAFFRNAGVPSGLLNIMRTAQAGERELIRSRFRQEYGGESGWHNLLVVDGGQASYTPMGMPLGERGLVLPELAEMDEARICAVFGVPLSLAITKLGQHSSSYANRRSDRESFWDETLAPIYQEIADELTRALVPEFGDLDYLAPDFGTVRALQEDQDAHSMRVLGELAGGLCTWEEARVARGYKEQPDQVGTLFVPMAAVPMRSDALPKIAEAAEAVQAQQQQQEEGAVAEESDSRTDGKMIAVQGALHPSANGKGR